MSEKELSEDGNIPHVPNEHANEAESSGSESDPADAEELEANEGEVRPVETESRDSGHDSPLEGAVGGSRDSGHDSPLEGAVGGALADDLMRLPPHRRRVKAGKADIFRKFFSKEYDQPKVPILDRRRHSAERQGGSYSSNPNPSHLGSSQVGIKTTSDNAPTEEMPHYPRFGTENGHSHPHYSRFGTENGHSHPIGNLEDCERCSIGSSADTLRMDDLREGTPSRPPSDDSRGLSSGSPYQSSPRSQTPASEKISPTPNSETLEGGEKVSSAPADAENAEKEPVKEGEKERMPVRQRRIGVVAQTVPIRSKSALAGCSLYDAGDTSKASDNSQKRKISKASSVRSEPLPSRKISKDSSVDSYEQMSLEDEAVNYPELSHSLEGDSCLPMPSSCRYQMEKGSGDSDRPSGSKIVSMPSVGEGDINTQLDEKIKKFLDEEASKEGLPIAKRIKEELPKTKKKFKQGTSVSDSEINEIIKKLGKSIDISNTDKEYNEFLNKYGCIYGEGFEICGPTEGTIDSKMKTEYISLKQLGFENRCKMNRMTEEEVKSCWLIAEIDQGDQYYIKYKKNKKWLIHSMDRYGKSKIFAKNFLEFLDKFFEAYEIKTQEGDSEEEDSELTE